MKQADQEVEMDGAEMMSRLSEYVDGTLSSAERAGVEAWLSGHPEGRQAVAELERVKRRAAELSQRPVPDAVWAGVRAGIRGPGGKVAGRQDGRAVRSRVSFSMVQLAAAAALLMVVGATGAWWALRGRRGPGQAIVTQPPVAMAHPTSATIDTAVAVPVTAIPRAAARPERLVANTTRADRSYDHAISDLQRVVAENRGRLSPATVKVIGQSLARIDSALARAQRALEKDPRNAYLTGHVTEMRQRKLELLQQTASLVSAS
ncbi:MAG TPA: hypothetical protein VFU45_06625 [Gemmatimonadales bacterium]|nr:hypothetical protein [Gemmatimonadales bacterium]